MSLVISRRLTNHDLQYRRAFGLSEIFGIGIAILERGDKLIFIAPNKDEFLIDVDQIYSAKRNRDRFLSDGIPCPPLPAIVD